MFRHIQYIILFFIVLLSTLQSAAQLTMPDSVCVGNEKRYWVNVRAGSTYTWKVNTITQSGNTNEIVINWDTPGVFLLEVVEKCSLGCDPEISSGLVYVNPPTIIPLFNPIDKLCQHSLAPSLLLKSINNITGVWTPATINTATVGTTTYQFTPDKGLCALPTTMDIVIDPPIIPIFEPTATLCPGSSPPNLPLISTNGIAGTWNPAIINTNKLGTSSYTFTPVAEICAAPISINVTVEDVTHPTFTRPPDIIIYNNAICSNNANITETGDVTDESDNCSSGLNATFTDIVNNTNPCSIIVTRSWILTDNSGNIAAAQLQTITIKDTLAPSLFGIIPSGQTNINKSINEIPEGPTITEIAALFKDNCGSVHITKNETLTGNNCSWKKTYTYLIVDDCNNAATPINIIYSGGDNIPPSFIALPKPIANITCAENLPSPETLKPIDNSGNADVTFSIDSYIPDAVNGYFITYRWKATDECNNTSVVAVTFKVLPDEQSPLFDKNPAIIPDIICGSELPVQETLTATDNCGKAIVSPSIDPYTVDKCAGFLITYRWKATDDIGNISEVTTTFNVLPDKLAPVFDKMPATINDIVSNAEFPTPESLTATDLYGKASVSVSIDEYIADKCNGYSVSYRWKATDDCGNSAFVTKSFNVLPDKEPPVFTSSPQIIADISCNDPIPVQETLIAKDNGEPITVIPTVDAFIKDQCNGYSITYRWTATDQCNNQASVSREFKILPDKTAPEFVWFPADQTVDCNKLPVVAQIGMDVLANDNCSGNVPIIFIGESKTDETCPNTYTLLRTWSSTDACGNNTLKSQKIYVSDKTAPTASALPNIGPYSCLNDVPVPNVDDVKNETDNCGIKVFVEFVNDDIQSGCTGKVIRHYRISDECGNSSILDQTITIDDQQAPTADVLPDLGPFNCYSEIPIPNIENVTGEKDNCTGNVVVTFVSDSGDPGCKGTVTRIYKIADTCGNSKDLIQQIFIDNKKAPTAAPLPTIGPFNCIAEIPANTEDVKEEKAYCGGLVKVAHAGDTEDPGCKGTLTRTYMLTDECGNNAELKQIITIDNKALPKIEKLPPLGPFTCFADIPAPKNESIKIESITCSRGLNVIHKKDTNDPGCSGTIIRTYQISDACGNSIEVTQDIIIDNKVLPTADQMPDMGPFQCYSLIPSANIEDVKNEKAACGSTVIVTLFGDTGDPGCKGMIVRKYKIEDQCGNISDINQIIYVDNNLRPDMVSPSDITVDNSSLVPHVYSSYGSFIGAGGKITDACGISESSFALTSENSDRKKNPETITRVYEIKDNCGNLNTSTQKITVLHDSKPEITAPANVTVECFDAIPKTFATLKAFKASGGTVKGVCEINTASFRLVKEKIEEVACSYFVTRIYEISDKCGNSNTCEHYLMSHDITAPYLVQVPGNLTVECEAPKPYASYDDFVAVGGLIADNCKIKESTFELLEEKDDRKSCPKEIIRTYQVADYCNNFVLYTQRITVADITPPHIVCVPRLTLDASKTVPEVHKTLNEFISGGAAISDNCGLDSLSFKLINERKTDFRDSIAITRTYEISDLCGNKSTCDWKIKSLKFLIPYMHEPDQLVTNCTTGLPSDYKSVDAFISAGGAVKSQCGIKANTFMMSMQNSDHKRCPETYTRTYQVVDSCGVMLTCQQKILLIDTTLPEMIAPRDTTIDSRQLAPPIPNTFEAFELGKGYAKDDCALNYSSFRFISEDSNIDENKTTLFRTYEITDMCGNVKSCVHKIYIKNIKTSISGAGDIEVECISEVPKPYTNIKEYIAAGAIINTVCAIDSATFAMVGEINDHNIPTTITRKYSFKTKCGDLLEKDQKIFVVDKTRPVFRNKPGDLIQHCGIPLPYANIGQFRSAGGEIIDNCKLDENSFKMVSQLMNGVGCLSQYYRIYGVSDVSGNTEYYGQNIIIQDTQAPIFGVNLSEMTVNCQVPPRWISYNEFIAAGGNVSDNCGLDQNSFKFVEEQISNSKCPKEIVRTYAISDNCGNVGQFKNKIILKDEVFPVLTVPQNMKIKDGQSIPEAFRNLAEFKKAGGQTTDNCMIVDNSFKLTYENKVYYTLIDSIKRQYQVSDLCQNTTFAEHVIVIERDSVPYISSPNDMLFSCSSELPAAYKTYDEFLNAGGHGATACKFINSTFKLLSNTISSSKCPEVITRIYELTDDCGKTAKTTHRIIISDQHKPVLSGKNIITVTRIDQIPNSYKDFNEFVADGGTAFDNCSFIKESFKLATETKKYTSCPISLARTYEIVDSCGNMGFFEQVFAINDLEKPQMVAPLDVTIDCLDAIPHAYKTPAEFITAGGKISDNTFIDESSFVILSEDPVAQIGSKQLVRTYQIADICGNLSTVKHTIKSFDNVKPVANCKNIMISLDANGKYELSQDDINNFTMGSHDDCTPLAKLKYTVTPSMYTCEMVGEMVETKVVVTDSYGNESTCSSLVMVLDNYIPEISCKNINLFLDKNGHVTLKPEQVVTVTSENCGIDTMFVSKSNFSCSDVGENEVIITIKDHTNVIGCKTTVTVIDTIAPVFTVNSVQLLIGDSEKATLTKEILQAVLFEACGISSYKIDKMEFTCADMGLNNVHVMVTDSNFNSTTADLIVQVIANNMKPKAINDTVLTVRDIPIKFNPTLNDRDDDGAINRSSFKLLNKPKHGSYKLDASSGEINYTPDGGYVGYDNMQYVVSDDGVPCITLSDTASIIISIKKPNIAPVGVDDFFRSGCDRIAGNVLTNDYDIDANLIRVKTKLVKNPEFGVVTLNTNGAFTYSFAPGFHGQDSLVYQICDNAIDSKCSQATVYITIYPDNDCDGVEDNIDIDDDNDGMLDVVEGDGGIDTDNDGHPDSMDIDSDNDGILDNTEAQEEGKYISPSGIDSNEDGLDDAYSANVPANLKSASSEKNSKAKGNENLLQAAAYITPVDTDIDGTTDFQDKDSDNDHVLDLIEGYDEAAAGLPSISPVEMDSDEDGLDDAYDTVEGRISSTAYTNSTGCKEVLQDFDGDGIRDWRDNDDDNDGIKTKFEDLNNDGLFFNDDLDADRHPEYLDINSDCTLFIPEGFSPDGDNVHDYFQMYCIESYPNAKLMVFDRSGVQVYAKEHYGNLEFWGSYDLSWWNGIASMGPNTNKKVAPEIYLYIFEFGNGKSQRGFIMVSY